MSHRVPVGAMWTVEPPCFVAHLNFELNVINLPRVVCLTVFEPSPYSSIPREKHQSYVIPFEFEWNGLEVSKVDHLKK